MTLKLQPQEKRKRDRPKTTWELGVRRAMSDRTMNQQKGIELGDRTAIQEANFNTLYTGIVFL